MQQPRWRGCCECDEKLYLFPVERRGYRWRSGSGPERQDNAPPQTGVVTPIILLVHVRGEIGLQDRRPEGLADQTAHGDLALLSVSRNRLIEISGPEGHHSELPVAGEFSAGRQVDVEEVGIAATENRRSRAAGQLRSVRDMVEVGAPDDIRSQVQLVAGVTQGKALVE